MKSLVGGVVTITCSAFVTYQWSAKTSGSLIPKLPLAIHMYMHVYLYIYTYIPLSVQFSRSVVSNSLWPHELQHTRPCCPSPTPRVYSNPCPSSRWCHPTISSSVVPFSSCPQSLPASRSFPVSQLFTWVAKVLEFHLQHQSFQWTPRTDLL